MYTDPTHIKVSNPGHVEGNTVFTYLDIFNPGKEQVARLKKQYQAGGLGDAKIKRYLNEVLEAELLPIRKRREGYTTNIDYVDQVLKKGSVQANEVASQTLKEVRDVTGIDHFD